MRIHTNALRASPLMVALVLVFGILPTIQSTAGSGEESLETKAANDSYQKFNLHKFAPPSLATAAFVASGAIKTEPIRPEDIDEEFSNIEDLSWLKPLALDNQALLLGEFHYYRRIFQLRNRVFFALNRWDYYPVLILEGNYSTTAYSRHCLAMESDDEAQSFALSFLTFREDVELMMHVRRWNKAHPEKRLLIAFSDIEHGLNMQPLIDFLQKEDPTFKVDPKGQGYSGFRALYPDLKGRILRAKNKGVVGPFPEADADYYAAFLENVYDAYKAYHFQNEAFNIYRQKAIVRNLTDPRFLGKDIEGKKFMLHAGAYHVTRAFDFPDGFNFLREGCYLEHDYPPTRGKTCALYTFATEYSLGAMADKDLSRYGGYGTNYSRILGQMRGAYEAGAIGKDEYVSSDPIELHEQVLWEIASAGNHEALRVVDINWDVLSLLTKAMPDVQSQVFQARQQFSDFDAYIFVPRSPLAELLPSSRHGPEGASTDAESRP